MINFFKNSAIVLAVIAGLVVLGSMVNAIPIWDYLTNIFVFIRMIIQPAKIIWDVDSLLVVVGWFFKLLTAGATFYSIYLVYKIFRK